VEVSTERDNKWLRFSPVALLRRLSNRQFLIVSAVLVGLWAGLTAVVLKVSVHFLQQLLKEFGTNYAWLYFVSPAAGILLAYLFAKLILNGKLARGTSHVLLAIAKKSSFLPRSEVFSHVVTSALTVGMGGSAGLESPIVQTGSAIGSTYSSIFPMGYRDRTLLLACGAASGIATAFNAPIAGVLFALEVLLVDVSISAFIPLLIAGATGALCSKIILAEGVLLSFKQVTNFNYHNVPYYLALGAICGLVSAYYIKIFLRTESLFHRLIKSDTARLGIGSLLLGGLVFIFPALFGEGYQYITDLATFKPDLLFRSSPLQNLFVSSGWQLGLGILVIGLVKVFAVSFTLNAGGNGGNFAPSLFVGACLGFSFALIPNSLALTDLPLSNFCLVAMAGVLTGIFHSPLTAVFLIAEITGGYELIIPLMIVSAISTAISSYLQPESLDQAKLKQGNATVALDKDSHVLAELSLAPCIETDFVAVRLDSNLRAVVDAVAHSKRNIFPVIDSEGNLAGIIALENIREIMFNHSQYDVISVKKLMQPPVTTGNIGDDMVEIMEKFDKTGVWNIPILDGKKYLGFISKSSIFSSYRDQLR
jgi:chloride channel protein, CIC family